jgi:hypothetical protein
MSPERYSLATMGGYKFWSLLANMDTVWIDLVLLSLS